MAEYQVTTSWRKKPNQQETLRIKFHEGITVEAISAPRELGDELFNPEQAFVASISNCHMLSFMAEASKKGLSIDEYLDTAVGFLNTDDQGKIVVGQVLLIPKVKFNQQPLSMADLQALHDAAHKNCFIANSVRSTIRIEPELSPIES